MYKVIITEEYSKIAKKWLKKHPELKEKYINTLLLLEFNPFHNSLRLHKLKGELQQFYSISLDMKYRIVIDLIVDDKSVILLNIGDHSIYRIN